MGSGWGGREGREGEVLCSCIDVLDPGLCMLTACCMCMYIHVCYCYSDCSCCECVVCASLLCNSCMACRGPLLGAKLHSGFETPYNKHPRVVDRSASYTLPSMPCGECVLLAYIWVCFNWNCSLSTAEMTVTVLTTSQVMVARTHCNIIIIIKE